MTPVRFSLIATSAITSGAVIVGLTSFSHCSIIPAVSHLLRVHLAASYFRGYSGKKNELWRTFTLTVKLFFGSTTDYGYVFYTRNYVLLFGIKLLEYNAPIYSLSHLLSRELWILCSIVRDGQGAAAEKPLLDNLLIGRTMVSTELLSSWQI